MALKRHDAVAYSAARSAIGTIGATWADIESTATTGTIMEVDANCSGIDSMVIDCGYQMGTKNRRSDRSSLVDRRMWPACHGNGLGPQEVDAASMDR